MFAKIIKSILTTAFGTAKIVSKSGTRQFMPSLEVLEERACPASIEWSGDGANNNWSTIGNWENPLTGMPAGRSPVVGDTIDFPAGTKASTMNMVFGSPIAGLKLDGYNINPATKSVSSKSKHILMLVTVSGDNCWSILRPGQMHN